MSLLDLPADIVRDCIVPLCFSTPKEAVQVSLVCKAFRDAVEEHCNDAWRDVFLSLWPMQNSKLKMRSWRTMLKRRILAFGQHRWTGEEDQIEGCPVVFRCPLRWSELDPSDMDGYVLDNEKTCSECGRSVVRVESAKDLRELASKDRCVAYFKEEVPMFMGVYCEPPFEDPSEE